MAKKERSVLQEIDREGKTKESTESTREKRYDTEEQIYGIKKKTFPVRADNGIRNYVRIVVWVICQSGGRYGNCQV